MKYSTPFDKLATALAKAQRAFHGIGKDATNPHFKSKYASLDAIMGAVREPLAVNGLSLVQGVTSPETNEGAVVGIAVETLLVHESGEWMSNTVTLPVDKSTAQGVGSAITYGRRYGVSALLALTTEEDDDGNAAGGRPAARQKPEPKRADPPAPPPVATVWDGTLAGAASFKFPFKHVKLTGVPLGEMAREDLRNVRDRLAKTDPDKYADIIARADAVLADLKEQESAT